MFRRQQFSHAVSSSLHMTCSVASDAADRAEKPEPSTEAKPRSLYGDS